MKRNLILICSFCFCARVFGEEAIELPDVTTEIGGESLKAGLDSIPDYRTIVPDEKTGGIQLPQMDGREGDSEKIIAYSGLEMNEKDIYAEGSIGSGFPFYFLGDFSIYRIQDRPFEIHFKHESTEGFGDVKASEGFFCRETGISAKKYNKDNNGEYEISAFYHSSDDGLQNESSVITNQVKHTAGVKIFKTNRWNQNYFFSYGAESNFYNRYSGLTKDAQSALDGGSGKSVIQEKSSVFYIEPFLEFGLEGKYGKLSFSLDYSSQLNLGDSDGFVKAEGSSSAQSSHRGAFGIEFKKAWFGFDGKIVTGSATGKNSVLFPFTLSVNLPDPHWNSSAWPVIKINGGLHSEQKRAETLENSFRYSFLNAIPVETSEWFGSASVTVPLSGVLSVNGSFDYRKTAFENGVWEPDYKKSTTPDYRLYGFKVKNMEQINTAAGADFAWNDFVFAGQWEAYWKDVPALKDKQNFGATAKYNRKGASWNASSTFRWGLGNGADKVPEIDAMAGWKLSKSVNLALETNDIIKLISKEIRDYCGSDYARKSGNVALVARFQF